MVPSFVRPCLLSFGYLNYKLFIDPCNTEYFLFWKKILEVKRGVTVVHVAIFPNVSSWILWRISLRMYLSLSLSGKHLGAFFRSQRNKSLLF